jgi:flavodoxin
VEPIFAGKSRQTMNRALVLYHSRTGTTAAYGEEIAAELSGKGFATKVLPLYRAENESLDEFNVIFLGCWTSGLLFFLQKPEKVWVDYIRRLPDLTDKEIVLFTTYKILTGSMFREMRKHLPEGARVSLIRLKSRNSHLTDSNRQLLNLLAGTGGMELCPE